MSFIIPGSPHYTNIQRGLISGSIIDHKFGKGEVGTSYTPITLSGFYRMPTAPVALEFLSDDAGDTSAGAGAREVYVIGLNSLWEEVTQLVVTNGTTPVALGTDLVRLYRWGVSGSGTYGDLSNASHIGELTIREVSGGAIWAKVDKVDYPHSQSQIGWITIPKGKTGFILSAFILVDSSKIIDAEFRVRPRADVIAAPFEPMIVAQELSGIDNDIQYNLIAPSLPLIGPCDFGIVARTSSGTADVTIDFEVLIIDD